MLERDNISIALVERSLKVLRFRHPHLPASVSYASTYYRKGGHEGRPSVFQRSFTEIILRSTPAFGEAFLGIDRRNAFSRIIGDQRNAGIEEVLALGDARLLACVGKFLDGFNTECRHHERILL